MVVVLPDFNGGGAERMCLEMLRRWPDRWQSPVVVVKAATGELKEEFLDLGIAIDVVGRGRSGRLSGIRLAIRTRRRVKQQANGCNGGACVISFLTTVPSSMALAGLRGVVHLASVQNPPGSHSWLRRRSLKWAARRATRVVPITPGIGKELEELGVGAERVETIPNGVETMRFENAELGSGEGEDARILVLGRLHGQKRIDRALEIFAAYSCREVGGRAKLTVCGDGPLADDVRRWIDRGEFCGGGVEMRGFTRDVAGILGEHDCLLVTSDFEGFGNVMVEALAAGVPVVASRVPYGAEYILGEDEELGKVCDAKDLECFVRGLVECVGRRRDPGEIEARRRRARDFESDAIAGRWTAAVEKALGAVR